ncbi:MAG: hypothetical protein KAG61_11005 [Bacteriovoracaceae bacterium]|nr:hypothetical protein [Bacteriovoracaceae bacterium]
MKNKLKNKISFIVYEYKRPPRFFEMKKSTLRSFFIFFPTISTIFFIAGIISLVQLNIFVNKKESSKVTGLRTQIELLKTEVVTAKDETEKLYKKFETTESKITNSQLLFSIPPAQLDLTENSFFKAEKVSVSSTEKETKLNFNLVNITKGNKRISGYFHILVKTGSGYYFYPNTITQTGSEFINFANGESFTTSRFRPVRAVLPISKKEFEASKDHMVYKVFIFSRGGDLIFVKNLTPKTP